MKATRKQPQSIDSQILAAINGRGRGSVFVPADFLDLGSREAVDIVLHATSRIHSFSAVVAPRHQSVVINLCFFPILVHESTRKAETVKIRQQQGF